MTNTTTIVVRNGLIVGSSGAAPGDLLIAADTILEVGPPGMPAPPHVEVLDAHDRAIMPGLVNAHVHGHGTLAKGLVHDRWPLELFLNALPSLGGHRSEAHKYMNGLVGAVEMLRKGCTACCDLFFEYPKPSRAGLHAVARAYSDIGVRAVVAPMVADRTFYQAYPDLLDAMPQTLRHEAFQLQMAPPEASADAVIDAIGTWPFDSGRIRPGLAPTIPLHCSDAFLLRCRDIAADYHLPLHMHLAESKVQAVEGLRRYGRTLTAHLAALGLLGPRFAAVHGIWLDDEDMGLLAAAGASVIHAPTSNMRFGSGLAAIRALRDRSVNVGIATDGTNTSDSLNMFEATRMAALVSRVLDSDFSQWLDAPEVFAMATEGSAQALGFAGRIGRIAPGYQADLVFLDLSHINYVPLGNALRQVVFTENGAAVDSVMVAGRLLLDHGRITTIDEAKLRRDAQAAADNLLHANAPLRAMAARLQPSVEQFCHGFACRSYHVQRLACAVA